MHLPRGREQTADVLVAGGVLVFLVLLVLVTPGGPNGPVELALALACAVVQAGTVGVMRRAPEAALAVGIAAGIGLELLAPGVGWLGQSPALLACYAMIRGPRRSLWVLALLVAATPAKLAGGDWSIVLLEAAGPALGWSLGELGRTRKLRREDERRRIVAQERTRIARELHDVLAHTVSVIVVQAAAAEDVFDRRPDQARKALGTIGTAARSTLAELRVLLQTMSAGEDGADPPGPQPGLGQLDALAASLGATGLRVELRTTLRELPAAVDLSAYRIVQESLTNTLRHSQATRARVTVHCADDTVRVEIHDDGPARAAGRVDGSGRRGILGMRERARLLGGTLDAGPLPDGGFRVRADLPVAAAA
ncbi:sensor histidine kinase [Actinoplanes friuliensis]|uniref:histidine kinase n=1 Tax=Actinoplanes friuliensis DSM 7358 TaxID=1246995 RepID=U5W5C7_9ACTN|nr:sensor histidine kinase [Actinoplanes friuliensis]AGZ43185.1 integral membrane sensor signal transduction histidine kinase [Actinoplanes friuliensis DSM 7358]